MKYIAVLLAATASAVQMEYTPFQLYKPPKKDYSDMMDIVSRGEVEDFSTMNVKKAMQRNGSSGQWPIPPEKYSDPPMKKHPHWITQDWETVVKKGNADAMDKNVNDALERIPEPIVINGKVQKPSEDDPLVGDDI